MTKLERKYSVAEIDRMRDCLIESMGSKHGFPIRYSRGVKLLSEQDIKMVEDRLRTYMLNGTDPGELEEDRNKERNKVGLLNVD